MQQINPMPNLLLIHLSDLHITESSTFWSAERAKMIARSAIRSAPYSAIILVISGDIAYHGVAAEYAVARGFFDHLIKELSPASASAILTICAPGNHDCNLSTASRLRDMARKDLSAEATSDPQTLAILSQPQEAFRDFEAAFDSFPIVFRNRTEKRGSIHGLGRQNLQIRVFNSSIYSAIKEKKGELFLPADIANEGWEDGVLRVAVMHHPTPWLTQEAGRSIRTALRQNAHIILFGHEHFPEMAEIGTFDSALGYQSAIEIDGAVLHGHEDEASSFVTLEYGESQDIRGLCHQCAVGADFYTSVNLADANRNEGWVSLPRKTSAFRPNEAMNAYLNTPGIARRARSGRAVLFADLYVYPDLAFELGNRPGQEELSDASVLQDESNIKDGILIQGEEKSGKTALLLKLFSHFLARGLVPLYICFRDHQFKAVRDLEKIFSSALSHNYENLSPDAFANVSRESKIF